MPIAVICPGCESKLNAPDSAAGKKIKCPKPTCGTLMIVPAPLPPEPDFEVVQDDPPKPKTKPKPKLIAAEIDDDDDDRPKKKSRRDDDDDDDDRPRKKRRDDDDDDDDDRPRSKRRRDDDDDDDDDRPRKKKKRKKSGMGAGVIVAIVIGGLVVLGGIGYGIYALVGGGKAAVPKGWVEFKSDSDKFKAYFPEKPESTSIPFVVAPGVESMTMYGPKPTQAADRVVGVIVVKFKSSLSASERDQAVDQLRKDFSNAGNSKTAETRSVKWAGQSAKEIIIDDKGGPGSEKMGGVVRYFITDTHAYIAILASKNGRLKRAEEDGFFDNFELLK